MRLAWATDIHLNFLRPPAFDAFCAEVRAATPDAVVLTGDLSEAPHLVAHLERLDDALQVPLHVVLGNHDYYRGRVSEVRASLRALCVKRPRIHWLAEAGAVPLGPRTVLVGQDTWADGRAGDYARSNVLLNDFVHIADLRLDGQAERLAAMQKLADADAAALARSLAALDAAVDEVIVAVHVPPFPEACWHEGATSGPDWQPFFTSVVTGEVLRKAALAAPQRRFRVLCGHTHSSGEVQILPNLHVRTGGAAYGTPVVADVLVFS